MFLCYGHVCGLFQLPRSLPALKSTLSFFFFPGLLLPGKPAALASEGITSSVGLTSFPIAMAKETTFRSNGAPFWQEKRTRQETVPRGLGEGGIKNFFLKISSRSGFYCNPAKERKGGLPSLTHSTNSY